MISKFCTLLIWVLLISGCAAGGDNSLNSVKSTAVNSPTLVAQSSSEATLTASSQSTSLSNSIPSSGLPICPDLPRPVIVFQAENSGEYILRHVASRSECTIKFEPPISRLLAMTTDGFYYSTRVIGEGSTKQKIIHYANDGTLRELPLPNADNITSFVISSTGSMVAWSQLSNARTAEGEEIVASELYLANADASDLRLLHTVDNAAEVKRGEPYQAWIIQPIRFLDDGDLLFTITPDGRGGSWNAQTGRYSNLYRASTSGGKNELVFQCPGEETSSFCIGAISVDSAYFTVTKRDAGEVIVFRMDGTPVATYSGPGQDYIGYPTFGPTNDLVFLSADVAEDQITIEQAFLSLAKKPFKEAAITLLSEPISFIWDWADDKSILYAAVEDGQSSSFSPSLVGLDGSVERLPERYGLFQGVQATASSTDAP